MLNVSFLVVLVCLFATRYSCARFQGLLNTTSLQGVWSTIATSPLLSRQAALSGSASSTSRSLTPLRRGDSLRIRWG